MHSIQHPRAFDLGTCPSCPELVSVRRQIDCTNFAVRYWVVCSEHGCLSDLSSWLDRDLTAAA